jgi:hypothetical protein
MPGPTSLDVVRDVGVCGRGEVRTALGEGGLCCPGVVELARGFIDSITDFALLPDVIWRRAGQEFLEAG